MRGGLARLSALLVIGVVTALACAAPKAPEVLAHVPDFRLIERDGSTVTRADLAGQPWVADFIFTRCVTSCPVITARMKELRRRLPPEVRSVSFSVDPEHDTPPVLSEYARKWQVEGRQWLFLTGSRPEMWTLIRKGFLLPVEDQPDVPEAPILHTNRFVLVDAEGGIRGTYEALDPDSLHRLLEDLRAIERSGNRS